MGLRCDIQHDIVKLIVLYITKPSAKLICMHYIILIHLYRVSHKKRNGGFSVHCEQKVVNIFTSLYKVSSAEENDT